MRPFAEDVLIGVGRQTKYSAKQEEQNDVDVQGNLYAYGDSTIGGNLTVQGQLIGAEFANSSIPASALIG